MKIQTGAYLLCALFFFNSTAVKATDSEDTPKPVDLEILAAHPDKYDGKEVRVSGYLKMSLGEDAVYPSEDASVDAKKGIWLEITDEEVKRYRFNYNAQTYVIEGTVNAKKHGRMGRWNGSIEKITRFELVKSE